ncbi:hypothetical protein K227x_42460 [Rubripirellula lacrimiformis]|uniref:Uncharacterized protein n=1 Tax=Rubripirellula lacrimiformis TaxID=1930273 RepID=A0A517NFD4_9BACT|nr:hypothetical protein K227x_42460 [Rubripirellula lacrimiformis]
MVSRPAPGHDQFPFAIDLLPSGPAGIREGSVIACLSLRCVDARGVARAVKGWGVRVEDGAGFARLTACPSGRAFGCVDARGVAHAVKRFALGRCVGLSFRRVPGEAVNN